MKTKVLYLFIALTLLCALTSPSTKMFAQGTAFTYQGQLSNGASPVNGLYNFKFDLWNAASGGAVIGGPVTNTAVPVTNGLFTTVIDFGSGVFTGSTNWLHIQVTTNGNSVFASLLPRQELTPTPYAIYAKTANAEGLSGPIPSTDLSGVDGTGLSGVALLAGGNNFSGNQTVSGTVQVDGLEQITGASGAGFHVDEDIGPNTYDVGEEHAINFNYAGGIGGNIGSMIMGYNGQGYFSVGNLYYGIGVSNTKAFTVFGDGNVNVDPMGMNFGSLNNGDTNSSGLTFGIGSGEGIASQRLPGVGDNQYGLDFYTDFAHRMAISQGGLVGINVGTNPPTTRLEVNGAVRTDGNELYLEPATAGSYANDGLVFGDGSLPGINYLNNGPWLAGFEGGALGALAPNTVALSWDANGNCWVSNNISANTVTVRNNSTGVGEYFYETGSSVLLSGEYLGVYGLGGVQPYIGDDGSGNDVQIGSLTHGVTAVACYNATDSAYMHLYCSSITIEGGADLAEPFKITPANQPVEEGEVVVIDDAHPGQLKLTDQPYDTRVAGVVSGANGINPGIQMHQQGLLEGGKNVALTGRVYVKADASNGAIKPGDLLTTSSTPGWAMRVSDHLRAQGAILGKAMTALQEGQGMVLVLVTLQ